MACSRPWDSGKRPSQAVGWVLVAAAAAISLGCSADVSPSRTEETVANMVKDVVIPIQAGGIENPVVVDEEVLQTGQEIFGQACAVCHGGQGRGRSNLGQSMYPPAMDLTSPHVLQWSDADLFWIIQNGIRFTGMPAWRRQISAEDTWKLVHFLRTLSEVSLASNQSACRELVQQQAGDAIEYGRILYRQEGCYMCHQLDGEGGTLGPDLTIQATRGRSDDWLIGHFRDPPAYTKGSIMPPFNNLADDQLEALVAFLQSQRGPSSPSGSLREEEAGLP